jgi:hypothetical protein
LLREVGYDRTLYMQGALAGMNALYETHAVRLDPLAPATDVNRNALPGEIVIAHLRPLPKGAALRRSYTGFRVRLDDGTAHRPKLCATLRTLTLFVKALVSNARGEP